MTASLGSKRHCPKCQSKFFDMGALEVCCPKCDYVFPIHLTPREKPLAKPLKSSKPVRYRVDAASLSDDDEAIDGLGDVIELEELDDDIYDDVDHLEEVEDHHEAPEVDINSDDADDEMFIDEIGKDDLHIIDDLDEDDLFEDREAR